MYFQRVRVEFINMNLSSVQYHLCHLNIGPARAPLTDPQMSGFVAKLDEINQLAYQSPGFVWHLQIDINNPEDLAMYGEPGWLFNLSVWESVEALSQYVYHSGHLKVMQMRSQWFQKMEGPNYVLWWLPVDQLPTLEEAKIRLAHLTANGPTPYAFTFKQPFPPPSQAEGINEGMIFPDSHQAAITESDLQSPAT